LEFGAANVCFTPSFGRKSQGGLTSESSQKRKLLVVADVMIAIDTLASLIRRSSLCPWHNDQQAQTIGS
jgi:hypothetical protein